MKNYFSKKGKKLIFSLILIVAILSFCFTGTVFAAKDIVVGGKFFTEQYILSEMTKQLLEKNGFKVETKVGLGSNLVRQAQEQKEVDIYWEYTGTSLVAYNKVEGNFTKQQTYDKVKELDAKKGIVWLKPANANNTFAFAMKKSMVKKTSIANLSQLIRNYRNKKLKIALTAEFIGRPDGLKGLEKAYGGKIRRANTRSMEAGLIYQALKDEKVDVGIVFATDGRISAFDLQILTDDKGFFPDYSLAPVVREEVLNKYPEIKNLMEKIVAKLDDRSLQAMNAAVDIDKRPVEEVSREFLKNL